MSETSEFLLAHLFLVVLGGTAFLDREVRRLPLASRVAVACLVGGIALTAAAVILTLADIPWSRRSLALMAIALPFLGFWCRRQPSTNTIAAPGETWGAVAWGTLIVSLLALTHWVTAILTSRATSVDFTFFWGVKAVRFAAAEKIDEALLRWQFFNHAVPEYPPLVPVTQAWGIRIAGEMPWTLAPLASVLWVIFASVLIYGSLRRHLTASDSLVATSFWLAAISISCAYSYSGGNAEAVLLAYESAALALVLTERPGDSRLLPAIMLAGAVMTKVEGVVAVGAIVLGVVLRDLLVSRRVQFVRTLPLVVAPLLAVLFWFFFQWSEGLPVGYKPHGQLAHLYWEHLGTIIGNFPKNLGAGSFGVAWLAPLLFVIFARKHRWTNALPGLALIAALFAFFVFDYLHDASAPVERIGWTLPRISQPALSAWILSAAAIVFLKQSSRIPASEAP